MNNVLINTPDLRNKGGVAQYYKVLQLDREPNIHYFNINNIGNKKTFRLSRTYKSFLNAINDCNIVVINPSLNSKSFFRDGVFAYLAKRKNKKVIVFWHGWDNLYEEKLHRKRWLKYIFSKTFGQAECFITLGEVFKQKLLGLGIRSNVQFYRETMSISEEWIGSFNIENKKIPRTTDKLDLFFISRVIKAKGVYTCVDIAKILKEKYHDKTITIHIAGDGDELKQLKQYAADNKIENVRFYGDVRGEEKYRLFETSDLFLFPTEHGEGFPNVVLEALFFGLPLITRPVAAIPDIIEHGKNGYIEQGTKAEDFIPHIDAYLEMPYEQRFAMTKRCHFDAIEKYNLKKVRDRTVNFYSNF